MYQSAAVGGPLSEAEGVVQLNAGTAGVQLDALSSFWFEAALGVSLAPSGSPGSPFSFWLGTGIATASSLVGAVGIVQLLVGPAAT